MTKQELMEKVRQNSEYLSYKLACGIYGEDPMSFPDHLKYLASDEYKKRKEEADKLWSEMDTCEHCGHYLDE